MSAAPTSTRIFKPSAAGLTPLSDGPTVSAFDRGFLYGQVAFETMIAIDGVVLDLEAHLVRLRRGARYLGATLPDALAIDHDRLAEVLPEVGAAIVRVLLTPGVATRSGVGPQHAPGPLTTLVTVAPYTPPTEEAHRRGLPARWSSVRRPAPACLPCHFKLGAVYAASAAAAREVWIELDDPAAIALMTDVQGRVSCAATANLFWIEERRLLTPARTCAVLPGVTRGQVMELGAQLGLDVLEVEVGAEALEAAEEVFMTASSFGVMALSLGDVVGEGPVCREVRLRLWRGREAR